MRDRRIDLDRARREAKALLRAARAGDADELYALLEDGAPPNARDRGERGGTALHAAAAAGHVDVVDVLVGWVPVDRAALDAGGHTALEVCADPVCAAILRSVGATRDLGDAHAEQAWAADAAWLAHVAGASDAAVRRVGDGLAVLTGAQDDTRNGVVCSRLAPEEADATLAELLAWFAAAGTPARWLLGPTTEPPDLGERLERAGCRRERGAVHMAARLDDLDLTPQAAPAGLELAVATEGDLRRHTATLDGHTVGDATALHVAPDLVAGVDLAVLRGARRRGIGRALVLAALRAARDEGATLAVLAPTPATVPFHEALGFVLERSAPDRVFSLPPRRADHGD
jgi:GNAT superfamily N-acetyltransferase